jgi:hypothetical protein
MNIKGVPGLTLKGPISDAEITIEDCPGLVIDGKFKNCIVNICGHGWKGRKLEIEGGQWKTYPGKVFNPGVNNYPAWIGDNMGIGSAKALNWRREWVAGNRQTFNVPRQHLKDSSANYFENSWAISDSTGKRYAAMLRKFDIVDADTIAVELTTSVPIKAGFGFWETLKPERMIDLVDIDGLEIYDHDSFDVYFAKLVRLRNADVGPTKLDYGFGTEGGWEAQYENVRAYGNNTPQGNASDIAARFGIRKVTTKDCEIRNLSVTSQGWYVGQIPEEAYFEDKESGWSNQSVVSVK